MVDKKVPELRFEGFDGDWEQRKLGESVKFINGRAYKQNELLDCRKYRVLRVGNFNTNDRWYYSDLELDCNKYANTGDLLYLWATSFGPEIWSEEKVIYHYHIWKLLIEENSINKQYLYTWLLTDKERIKQSTNGTTMVHITKGNMEIREFQFPKKITEQKLIGMFFKKIDDTTALHQQKLDQLKRLKQGFLQILFGNKEQAPKVRFAGFDEEWEQRKLGEVVECFEYGLNAAAREYDGKNKYLRITDIDEETHLFKSEKLTSPDINLSNADNYKLKENDVLFARTGASVGKTYRYRLEDGLIYYAGFLIRARIKSEFSTEFIFQNTLTSKYNQYIKIASQRSGQPGVNAQEYSKFELFVPNLEEQQKIGSFFKQLDDAIALHQTKLEKLKQLKQAFLQKMFI
ncbi:restriction endonuclease subunit S [Enterococcus thailandicus]|uniref:restriction endonuclease subunit S n=1 Tax=Enterococcus thailandicus TaxID=417368 RepID=UPI0025435D52|nr:restriction endonuclease subunit S [Enterococcus thailandicus]MDK4352165.1 restriction endonuclease subunit S [Enterococcus thailandicus]